MIDVGKIIGLDVFRSRDSLLSSELSKDKHGDHEHDDSHEHSEQFHKIRSLQIDLPKLTVEQHEQLDEWLRSILWDNRLPSLEGDNHGVVKEGSGEFEVLRTKGFFTTSEGSFVIQGVRELYDIIEVEMADEETMVGKLVLIGKGLDDTTKSNFVKFVKI